MNNKFEQSSHYDNANPKILDFYENENNVLDVGCSTGLLAKKIKTINSNAKIDGIDIFPLPEENRNSINNFFVLDLDTQKLPQFSNKFDLIILGDILEHLKRPDIILKSLKELLSDNGKIIISVPNVAYFRNRIKLLFGNFDYTDTGIMDKTHLRFFTQKTIKNLIIDSGYKIEKENFVFYNKLNFIKRILPKYCLNIFYRLLSVQFVFKIKI